MTLAATKASSRHRVRITNKTRLRVTRQPLDEFQDGRDDEVVGAEVSTAGVDVEDAKEHHLQAVLHKQQAQDRVHIPIPDHAGIVSGYDAHYPEGRWTDPFTYVKISSVVEECIDASLNDECTYYMDEKDQEWLDAQNKYASTLPPTPVSAAPRTLRRGSTREPVEPPRAFPATYDEFELVMGLLELVTERRHRVCSDFSEYLDVFAAELTPDLFASYEVPSWVPAPARMLALASSIFAYWKGRRERRHGARIIPVLNYDESDVKNESYVCYRRREVKAVRKTRHSNAATNNTVTKRLQRLQGELATCSVLADALRNREVLRQAQNRAHQVVWNARKTFSDLRRSDPSLGEAADNELLVDKEPTPRPRPKKSQVATATEDAESRARTSRPKKADSKSAPTPTPISSSTKSDKTPALMHPQERYKLVKTLEDELEQDVQDADMDDAFDDDDPSGYEHGWARSYASQTHFLPSRVELVESDSEEGPSRVVRLRHGRNGVRRVDRRVLPGHRRQVKKDQSVFSLPRCLNPVDATSEEIDAQCRRRGQWLFDKDEFVEPETSMLVDDYSPKYLIRTAGLITASDRRTLYDSPFSWTNVDGTTRRFTPIVDPMSVDIWEKQRLMDAYIRAKRREAETQRQRQQQPPTSGDGNDNSPSSSSSGQQAKQKTTAKQEPVSPEANTTASGSTATSTPRLSSFFTERPSTPNSLMAAAHAHGRTAMQPFHRGAMHMPCVPVTKLSAPLGTLNTSSA